ncbi:hypothetical protein GX553_01140 [Candidatus Peribacteria bacterium]|nr:hypothetical protein [Candidatus Peribacteria bacterium]
MRVPWLRRKGMPILYVLTVLLLGASEPALHTHTFEDPIDAVSLQLPDRQVAMEVRGWAGTAWTQWYELEAEDEADPLMLESNLVLFPQTVHRIQVRGSDGYAMHPVRVSSVPPRYAVASISATAAPRILRRSEWGADENFLFSAPVSERSEEPTKIERQEESTPSIRVRNCQTAQQLYPEEFRLARTQTQDASGRTYRWPQQYSPSVQLLVVHHTAQRTIGDERPGYERMRALYTYHANTLGWGDVGYHYIIDENGQIYEGRAGGNGIVGGHAYCANIGTVGVALMGNFDLEIPAQAQVRSLQWLLKTLADTYDIDLNTNVDFHGVSMDPIVGHRTLMATACPGYFMYQALSQVRQNVRSGNTNRSVTFPRPRRTAETEDSQTPAVAMQTEGIRAIGSTTITGAPGGQTRLTLFYTSGDAFGQRRDRIADVERSHSRIGVWQDMGDGEEMRVRRELLLPQRMQKHETITLSVRIQLPREEGSFQLRIGDVLYTLNATGRQRTALPLRAVAPPAAQTNAVTPQANIVRPRPTATVAQTSVARTATARQSLRDTTAIRIRLGYSGDTATVLSAGGLTLRAGDTSYTRIDLSREGDSCIARESGTVLGRGIVRITPGDGITTVASWQRAANRFRGVLECRIVDGELVLINEIPMEDYIAGLAEEPDSEPYEKQRAFAIAARSYAAHYREPSNTKFPGMPYHGDDSPARFQAYHGAHFESSNPQWVRAVKSTAGIVVKKDGSTVRTAYFSSDDGRTRSPEEVGWPNFPFAEVFSSKPDPWCAGLPMWGHGVGMSGCGARGQALEGKTAEEILEYYYPGTVLEQL